jgi:hypothetical protein
VIPLRWWIELGVIIAALFGAAIVTSGHAGTRVWLMYGWGDNFAGTSSGIDEIAARARTIPGVVDVRVHNYWDTTTIYNEVLAAPAGDRIVLGGYSCGANSATVVARALWQSNRKAHTIANIQMSKWCGGEALESNVHYGQSTYNADCSQTLGLGCKPLEPAPSFMGHIVNINRPDRHGAADNDPATQDDVLKAIAATSLYGTRPVLPPRPVRDCRFAWTSERGVVAACKWTTRGGRMITVVFHGNQQLRVAR